MDILPVVSYEPYPLSFILHKLQSQSFHMIHTLFHSSCMGYEYSMIGQRYYRNDLQ